MILSGEIAVHMDPTGRAALDDDESGNAGRSNLFGLKRSASSRKLVKVCRGQLLPH